MKNVIKALLVIGLIVTGLGCTSDQLKSVGTSFSNIIPNLLADISAAYGNPYGSLVGQFFKLIVGDSDEGNDSVIREEYPEDQIAEEGVEDTYYEEEVYDDEGTQADEYVQEQPGEEYYDQEPQAVDYAAEAAHDIYPDDSQSLQVSIDVIKEDYRNGSYVAVPVEDGDTLSQKDNYKVLFKSQTPCYMYIAQLDATGKLDPIFPSRFTQYRNPIQSGKLYDIPSGKHWFYLDANRGVETIYFIASRTPRQDIDRLFQVLEERNRNLVQKQPLSINQAYSVNRGIGGVRPGKNQMIRFQNGSHGQYASTLFESIEADFVMTRWFNHI